VNPAQRAVWDDPAADRRESVVAGIAAALASGLGAFNHAALRRHVGLGYAFAGDLMFAGSVYNLLMPAFASDATWPRISGRCCLRSLGMLLVQVVL
jgi:hypothetical protein